MLVADSRRCGLIPLYCFYLDVPDPAALSTKYADSALFGCSLSSVVWWNVCSTHVRRIAGSIRYSGSHGRGMSSFATPLSRFQSGASRWARDRYERSFDFDAIDRWPANDWPEVRSLVDLPRFVRRLYDGEGLDNAPPDRRTAGVVIVQETENVQPGLSR